MELTGVTSLQAKLAAIVAKSNTDFAEADVEVGFSQSYAVIVHEDLQAKHKEGKSAKFLEIPARALQRELGATVLSVYKRTGKISQGLMVGGLRLLREAQMIVPIDTAALKNSGYCSLAKDAPAVAMAAFTKSQALRLSKLAKRANKTSKNRSKTNNPRRRP